MKAPCIAPRLFRTLTVKIPPALHTAARLQKKRRVKCPYDEPPCCAALSTSTILLICFDYRASRVLRFIPRNRLFNASQAVE